MTRALFRTLALLLLAACSSGLQNTDIGEQRDVGISSEIAIRPQARPEGFEQTVKPSTVVAPSAAATTAEEFDTTTASQREVAAEVPSPQTERRLGTTVASLGAPTEPGFWLKTPLVKTQTQGRVVFPGSGKSAQVTLIPIDGPETAGSRMSLSALRLIDAPLTGLPVVEVFVTG